jgi:hypothetical protein
MRLSNSDIPPENENFEMPLRLISLSNGALVLGKIAAIEQNIVQMVFPVSLRVVYDGEGDIVTTSAIPYQMPFAVLSPFSVVNFNLSQIVSFAEPAPELIEQYKSIMQKVTEKFVLTTMKDMKQISDETNKTDDIWEYYLKTIH